MISDDNIIDINTLPTEKKNFSSIEKAGDYVFYSVMSIPDFINLRFPKALPDNYRTAAGVDLSLFEPAVEYCTYDEIERVREARSLKRQIEWLCGRVTLKELIQSALLPELNHKDIVINYSQSGRPYISGHKDMGISLSHSGDLAMAAIYTMPGKRIGIDIEKTTGADTDSLLSVAFSAEERAFYKDKSPADIIKAFTIKEAYLKFIGQGFHEVITKVSSTGKAVFFEGREDDGIELVSIPCTDDYCATLIFDRY